MICRNRKLRLRVADLDPGPILAPSISSKGFPVFSGGVAESGIAFELVAPEVTETLLISAYDLHYKLVPDADKLLSQEHRSSLYGDVRLLIIDSGGYELNPHSFEGGETWRGPYVPRRFVRQDFEAIIDRLPQDRDLIVVTYDSPERPRATYQQQRTAAQEFFAERPHLLSNFLLKPQLDEQTLNVSEIEHDAANFKFFDVVGVTEKELGNSLIDRLVVLAQLRRLLDMNGCTTIPIHVFGSLDPIITSLYFFAGGDIFDGLSWLRYAYVDGLSVHPDELAVLRGQLHDGERRRDLFRYMSNLAELRLLRERLRNWSDMPDRWERLGPRFETMHEIYDAMRAELRRRS